MATQKSNIPALRFPEFKGEWIISTLDGAVTVNPKSKQLPSDFVYIDLGSVKDGQLIYQQTISLDDSPSRAQRLLSKEDILFQIVRPYQKNNLFYNLDGDYVASTGYAQLRVKKSNPKFIYQYLHTENFVRKVNVRCTGTSYPSINSEDLAKIRISYPDHKDEQKKIADFLTAVDQKIAQLIEKKSCLEQYKKGVMQRLFTQRLRFHDTNGNPFPDWEEKELGELLDYEQPTKYLVESTEYDDSYPIPVLTAGKTFILGYTNEEDGVFSKNLPVIIFDDFTTATQFVDFEFKAKSSAMKILKAKNHDVNIKLVYEFIQLLEFPIGEHKRYWISEFQYMNIPFPCAKEQQKIADFLTAIDTKITALGNQLTAAQDFKKSLLQKMFV